MKRDKLKSDNNHTMINKNNENWNKMIQFKVQVVKNLESKMVERHWRAEFCCKGTKWQIVFFNIGGISAEQQC